MIWGASPNIGLIPQYALSDRPSEKDGGPSLALGSLRVSEEGFASKSGSEMPRLKSNFWHEICILFGMNANGARNERKEEMKESMTTLEIRDEVTKLLKWNRENFSHLPTDERGILVTADFVQRVNTTCYGDYLTASKITKVCQADNRLKISHNDRRYWVRLI